MTATCWLAREGPQFWHSGHERQKRSTHRAAWFRAEEVRYCRTASLHPASKRGKDLERDTLIFDLYTITLADNDMLAEAALSKEGASGRLRVTVRTVRDGLLARVRSRVEHDRSTRKVLVVSAEVESRPVVTVDGRATDAGKTLSARGVGHGDVVAYGETGHAFSYSADDAGAFVSENRREGVRHLTAGYA